MSMQRFAQSDWASIDSIRTAVAAPRKTVCEAAQLFVETLGASFSSVVLARVFLVVPYAALPSADKAFATHSVAGDERLTEKTRVLSLIGTHGVEPSYCDRGLSKGHLAIPLLDTTHVQNIPMIAKLLADLEVDFAGLDDGRPIATRRMLGGRNGTFFIADAQTAADARERFVIPSRDFVSQYAIRTVFGMGGAYVDGTLAVAVLFTNELIDRAIVDRYPSLISNFKMATAALLAGGRIYK